ncbi:hypothetical protein SGGMMB4_03715 [Sodalis glossinidius str. 'morsitans']|uniref:Uncharacterized protein n=1 Tax=Sodalis glossinidius (strain morsitans) TaxID=343509 RepID=A0A193QKT6_SODGM|nr:hypothetical protein SGGMMB4_03715 [Sodalis glossinidius str. 'morsitans']
MLSLLISTLRQHLNAHLLPAAPGVRQLVLPWPYGAAVRHFAVLDAAQRFLAAPELAASGGTLSGDPDAWQCNIA